MGAFHGKAINALSPGVDKRFGIEETPRIPKSKEVTDSPKFLPLSPSVDNKGSIFTCEGRTGARNRFDLCFEQESRGDLGEDRENEALRRSGVSL